MLLRTVVDLLLEGIPLESPDDPLLARVPDPKNGVGQAACPFDWWQQLKVSLYTPKEARERINHLWPDEDYYPKDLRPLLDKTWDLWDATRQKAAEESALSEKWASPWNSSRGRRLWVLNRWMVFHQSPGWKAQGTYLGVAAMFKIMYPHAINPVFPVITNQFLTKTTEEIPF